MLMDVIAAMDVEFTLRDLMAACPVASRELARTVLKALSRSGHVRSRGRGRAARWRRIRRIPDACLLNPSGFLGDGHVAKKNEHAVAIRALADLRAAAMSYGKWSASDRREADMAWLVTLFHLPERWLHPDRWVPSDFGPEPRTSS